MPKLFVVRSNSGEYTASFIKGGYVAIGWLPEKDLRGIINRYELDSIYSKYYGDEVTSKARAQHVGEIYRFINDIEIGDYVITQSETTDSIYYGVVEGEYAFRNYVEDDCPFFHRRNVKWISKISRNQFSYSFQSSLQAKLTVFQIKDNDSFFSIINEEKVFNYEFQSDDPDYFDLPSAKDEFCHEVSLFYGTNRIDTGSKKLNEKYGEEPSDLKFGKCKVTIPLNHRQGEIERPLSIWAYKVRSEDPNKDVVIRSIQQLSREDFNTTILNDVKNSEPSALIFIHGYNNTFAEAAWRTAQIVYDIPFNGVAGFYSWPSGGKTFDYFKDEAKARATIPKLQDFLENFLKNSKVTKLHLIAHSMGNLILTSVLCNMSTKQELKEDISTINQIVLAAPDIDQGEFRSNILPRFRQIGQRRTLYASVKDKALDLSGKLRMRLPRLGDGGSSLFVETGLDTVDASDVPIIGSSHSYIFETEQLLADLHHLLNFERQPKDRRLKSVPKNNFIYWIFRS